jgi:hypothetical protein
MKTRVSSSKCPGPPASTHCSAEQGADLRGRDAALTTRVHGDRPGHSPSAPDTEIAVGAQAAAAPLLTQIGSSSLDISLLRRPPDSGTPSIQSAESRCIR